MIVRPSSSPGVKVQLPSPLLTPADKLAPFGTLLIVTLRLSEPSRSVSTLLTSRPMAVSSIPLASLTVSSGVSATAVVDTVIVSLLLVVESPSVLVAVTVSSNSPA